MNTYPGFGISVHQCPSVVKTGSTPSFVFFVFFVAKNSPSNPQAEAKVSAARRPVISPRSSAKPRIRPIAL